MVCKPHLHQAYKYATEAIPSQTWECMLVVCLSLHCKNMLKERGA